MTRTLLTITAAIIAGTAYAFGFDVAWRTGVVMAGGLALIAAVTFAGPVIQAIETAIRERISFREAWGNGE